MACMYISVAVGTLQLADRSRVQSDLEQDLKVSTMPASHGVIATSQAHF